MKTTVRITLLAVTLFLLVACQQAAEPAATVDLAGTNWILSSLNGELPLAGTAVTLQFGTDGSILVPTAVTVTTPPIRKMAAV